MDDIKELVEREQEAYLALSRIRDARDLLPIEHPAAAALDTAMTLAEDYWRGLRAAVEPLEQGETRDLPGSPRDVG
jgi:hypothetical protein